MLPGGLGCGAWNVGKKKFADAAAGRTATQTQHAATNGASSLRALRMESLLALGSCGVATPVGSGGGGGAPPGGGRAPPPPAGWVESSPPGARAPGEACCG